MSVTIEAVGNTAEKDDNLALAAIAVPLYHGGGLVEKIEWHGGCTRGERFRATVKLRSFDGFFWRSCLIWTTVIDEDGEKLINGRFKSEEEMKDFVASHSFSDMEWELV